MNPQSSERLDRLGRSFFGPPTLGQASRRLARLSPTTRVLLSFLLLIVIGTALLWLPLSSAAGWMPLSFVDALFVATSAVCVTGLTPLDVGLRLSGFGQASLLLLIQLGGLGFLTLSTGLLLSLGQRTSLLSSTAVAETWLGRAGVEMRGVLRSLFAVTFTVELLGALVLAGCFSREAGFTLGRACWFGLFHAVSAFCNAGFSLCSAAAGERGDNLAGFTQQPLVNAAVIVLIVLGGVGFLVIHDVLAWVRSRGRRRLGLHAKIVLSTSAALLLGGAVLFFLFERRNPRTLGNLCWYKALLPSFFQSVTARTAGFNTLDIGALRGPTLMLLMVLMFIGGSPASCAGGVKTTTAFVIFRLAVARLRSRRHPTAFGRGIGQESVTRAATLILAAGLLLALLCGSLMILEAPLRVAHARSGVFMDLLFESVSCFGTVGLSTGVTAGLSAPAKLVLVAGMYIGRLGPLTVFIALAQPPRRDKVRFPEEPILVG